MSDKTPDIVMAVDYYDLVWKSEALFDQDAIKRFLEKCAEHKITSVLWRVSAFGALLYHSETEDNFLTAYQQGHYSVNQFDRHHPSIAKMATIMRRFDPLAAAAAAARDLGLRFLPWLTLYDEFGLTGELSSALQRRHPEMCWKAFDGEDFIYGMLSYVYPEVQAFKLKQIQELLEYDVDGVYLCDRTHSRSPNYRKALVRFFAENPASDMKTFHDLYHLDPNKEMAAAAGRYGFDGPAVREYIKTTGKQPTPDDAEWWRWRGRYFMGFLEQASRLTKTKKRQLAFGLRPGKEPFFLYPPNFFPWREMCQNGLIDELHYQLLDDRQVFVDDFPGTKTRKITRLFANAFLSSAYSPDVPANCAKAWRDGVIDGVQLFEAMHFFLEPKLWEIVPKLY